MTDFKPGEVILGKQRDSRWVVADRVFTSQGKLRLVTKNGNIRTTWWKTHEGLPEGYRMEVPNESA